MARSFACLLLAGLLAFALGGAAAARDQEFPPEFRALKLGVTAQDMPMEGLDFFACGSKGGPPLGQIEGWSAYAQCAADEKGLHEVYVEYNSDLKSISDSTEEQFGVAPWFRPYAGTRVADFAVVMSMLFDDEGVARGFRVVTDQRAGVEERAKAYLLKLRILPRYGRDDWACTDREPGPREAPVGHVYINQLCEKRVDGKYVTVESHLFRKAGQTGVDLNGKPVPGQFESLTTWEAYDAAFLDGLD